MERVIEALLFSALLFSTKIICAIDAGAAIIPNKAKIIPVIDAQLRDALTIFKFYVFKL